MIKIFMSYSTENKSMVGELKSNLESLGFEVFIAHEDIEPSRQWQDVIVENIISSDVFIPVLTKIFKTSDWTDQETGIAFYNKKLIIPLHIEIVPYGFIGRYQDLKINIDHLDEAAIEILETIRNHKPDFNNRITSSVIERFEKSTSYREAAIQSRVIAHMKKLSHEEVNKISRAIISNDQIHGSWGAASNIRFFLSTYSKYLDKENHEKLKERYSFN